jgi:hydroxyethylthiazole kinase-like uncharacterized protein yjeF
MTKIITGAQMQELDRRTIGEAGIPGTVLMERAGAGLAACIEQFFGSARGKRITILCGKGNNGGDGFVVARLLRRSQAKVRVLTMTPVRAAGKSAVPSYRSKSQAFPLLRESDILVDALLGTGLSSDVTGRYGDAIDSINEAGKPVVAVDLPSGLHADTGAYSGGPSGPTSL